jgi:hypothetical protein
MRKGFRGVLPLPAMMVDGVDYTSGAETEEDRQGLLELAQTWTRAALIERHSIIHQDTTVSTP